MAKDDNPEGSDLFTPQEREYFESRGEKDIPPEKKQEAPIEEKLEPTETVESSEPSQQAAEGEEKETPREERKVDHGALVEERERRKAAEDRAREAELLNARMEERFKAWQERTRPPPRPPQRPPRADEDIFGAVNYLQRTTETVAKELDGYKKREAATAQMQELMGYAVRAEAEYKKATPDYDNALNFLRESRKSELRTWGMETAQVEQQLILEERQLIARAAQARRNPAEMAYTLAKQRGYAPGRGATRQDTADQLDRIERGQQQNRSMSGTGGNSRAGGEITLADLVRMPEAEFAAFKQKYPARYRRLKGG
jgi:hypothetical protein